MLRSELESRISEGRAAARDWRRRPPDNSVRLWGAATGRAVEALRAGGFAVASVAWDPCGNALATAGLNGAAALWDLVGVDRRLALAMALHPRLGRGSPLWLLEREVLRERGGGGGGGMMSDDGGE